MKLTKEMREVFIKDFVALCLFGIGTMILFGTVEHSSTTLCGGLLCYFTGLFLGFADRV